MSRVIYRVREREMLAHRNSAYRRDQIQTEPPWTWKDSVGVFLFLAFIVCALIGFGMFIHFTFIK